MRLAWIFALSFVASVMANCIPWVGGQQAYVAGDCISFEGNTYIAQREVNAWTHPSDTWHWQVQGLLSSSTNSSSASSAKVVVDPMVEAVNHPIETKACNMRNVFPLSTQSYVASAAGLIDVYSQLQFFSYGEGTGFLQVKIIKGGVTRTATTYVVLEPQTLSGRLRQANARQVVPVTAGEAFQVVTDLTMNFLDRDGKSCIAEAAAIENTTVTFTEGAQLLSATTLLKRQ